MKIKKSVDLQNLTRGVVAVSRSHGFRKNGVVAKNNLQGSLRQLLIKAGTKIPPTQYSDYINWAEKLISSLAPGVNPLIAPDYLSLSYLYEISKADWQKTLSWVEARLSPHHAQIKSFFEQCANAEALALNGQLQQAAAVLENAEKVYGPSVHLVELRLAVSQLKDGVEGQKKIAAEMSGAGKGGLIGLLIYLISIRNENRLSLASYKEQVESRADKFRDKQYSTYLRYRLLREDLTDEKAAASVLQVEENHTIYDLAHTAHSILGRSPSLAKTNAAKNVLEITKQLTGMLNHELNVDEDNLIDCDEEVKHDNVNFLYKCLHRKLRKTKAPSINQLRALSFLKATLRKKFELHSGSLYGLFSECLATEMLGLTGTGKNSEFLKSTLNFSCFPVSAYFMNEARSRSILQVEWPGASIFTEKDISLAEIINGQKQESKLMESLQWILALQHNKKEEFLKQFLIYVDLIVEAEIPRPIYVSLQIAKAYSCVQLQMPGEVSKLISILALDYDVKPENLPIGNFYERISWKNIAKQENYTQIAIAIELFSRKVTDAKLDSYKKYAIDDLLARSRKIFPSQLTIEDCKVSLKQFHYFFNVICIQKNLDMLHALKGTIHLDNERKNILSFLASSDKNNAAIYNAEILGILHKTRIAQGVALIDRSRIHVDEDPLVNKLSLTLLGRWDRYKSLEVPVETSLADLTSILRTIEKSEDDNEVFKVPKNESASLLLELVGVIQDAFLNDVDHGLDRHLGHRIRHNGFANQVRGGLGDSHILTKKIEGQYQESSFWQENLSGEKPEKRMAALVAMKNFSADFDGAIDSIKEGMIRVRRSGYPEGIFDINVSVKVFYLIKKYVSVDSNLPTFIASCFQIFWQLLIPSLQMARERVGTAFSGQIGALFSRLMRDISALNLVSGSTLESTIVQAKNETSRAIDQAAKWFNKSAIDENSHIYSVKDAADILVEACVSSRKGSEPQVKISASGDIEVHAPALYQLSDIFWILIDNACAHCGIDRGVVINITVKAFSADGVLVINVRNLVVPGLSEQASIENICSIKSDIDKKNYSEKLLVEGKSGLKKLAAVALKYPGGKIDFDLINSEFSLHLEIPLIAVYIPEKGGKK